MSDLLPEDRSSSVRRDPGEPPETLLATFGWVCEATNDGVRLWRGAAWRVAMIGCSFAVLLFFLPIVAIGLYFTRHLWLEPPIEGVWRLLFLAFPLAFLGLVGLFTLAIVGNILRLALLREAWEASRNLLVVKRRLLGFSWQHEFRDAGLVLEPIYEQNREGEQWRLAVVGGGERQYLLREPAVAVGGMVSSDAHAEATGVANLLAQHTGWNVTTVDVTVEGLAKPPCDSDQDELLAALRSWRFVIDVDERMRLTIRPPKFGQRMGGIVFLVIASGWLWLLTGAVDSYLRDAQVQQQPLLMHVPFWLLMTPLLMVGVGLGALGLASFFGRERWTVDHNLLIAHSRLLGWKSEHEYVDARWILAREYRTTSKGRGILVWQLQIENSSGGKLKVLRTDRDDDVPRMLGTLLSRRTGWDLQTTEP